VGEPSVVVFPHAGVGEIVNGAPKRNSFVGFGGGASKSGGGEYMSVDGKVVDKLKVK